MFESNSKFPKIFVYIMSLLTISIFTFMFFGMKFVAISYFIAIIIGAILLVLDRKYGELLTNYKLTYLLFEILNLIAIISVIYHEYAKHTEILNLFLILLVIIEVLMIFIDIFVLKNKNLTRTKDLIIDFIKLCSMICIITYFFGVSKLYFSIFAFVFESINLSVKVISFLDVSKQENIATKEQTEMIEDIIHSNDDNDGEVD